MQSNLTDPQEIELAEQKEKDERRRQLNDIRTLLSSSSGRRFMWRLLEKCNCFGSIYSNDSSYMAYSSGQQDFGHFLMSEIVEADNNLLIKLMKENRKDDV